MDGSHYSRCVLLTSMPVTSRSFALGPLPLLIAGVGIVSPCVKRSAAEHDAISFFSHQTGKNFLPGVSPVKNHHKSHPMNHQQGASALAETRSETHQMSPQSILNPCFLASISMSKIENMVKSIYS